MKKLILKNTITTLITTAILLSFTINTFSQNRNLSDIEVKARTNHIQTMLDDGKFNANLWWWGWTGFYSVVTIGQGTWAGVTNDTDTRNENILGASTAFLGFMGQIIAPMTPASAPDDLKLLPDSTTEERIEKLKQAELLLKLSAEREIEGRSWLNHLLAGVVNLTSGIILWKGLDQSMLDGFLNFALGMVVSEVQIFTQPTKAIDDYDSYRSKYYKTSHNDRPEKNWFITVYPSGFITGIRF